MNLHEVEKFKPLAEIVEIESFLLCKENNIEVARVLHGAVVVKKGTFKVGDLAVYIHIGVILDFDVPGLKVGSPVASKLIRGHPSHGVLLPLSILYSYTNSPNLQVKKGDDVSGVLKVKK